MTTKIKVILADDHPLVRAGLRTTLATDPDIELVGEATTGDEVKQMCLELRPDVLLLDLRMPGSQPLDTMAFLHKQVPAMKVIILTAYNNEVYIRGMAASGAVGYILKDQAPEVVVEAIHTTMRGGTWFTQPMVNTLANPGKERPVLNERERQILGLLMKGLDNVCIAKELGLAEQTVRNNTTHLYAKLGVNSRAEAIVWAKDQEWEE